MACTKVLSFPPYTHIGVKTHNIACTKNHSLLPYTHLGDGPESIKRPDKRNKVFVAHRKKIPQRSQLQPSKISAAATAYRIIFAVALPVTFLFPRWSRRIETFFPVALTTSLVWRCGNKNWAVFFVIKIGFVYSGNVCFFHIFIVLQSAEYNTFWHLPPKKIQGFTKFSHKTPKKAWAGPVQGGGLASWRLDSAGTPQK